MILSMTAADRFAAFCYTRKLTHRHNEINPVHSDRLFCVLNTYKRTTQTLVTDATHHVINTSYHLSEADIEVMKLYNIPVKTDDFTDSDEHNRERCIKADVFFSSKFY
ncbi:hypothetical protein Btru_016123 [Bulinus truncatus]|nr:hypothetical protein Btru_016123 [Bulinus truncatus]